MKIRLLVTLIIVCFSLSCFAGDMYEWIDKDGVRHFTNEPPPPGAKIVQEGQEIPYDAAKDKARSESDSRFIEQTRAADTPEPVAQPEPEKPKSAVEVDVQERSKKTWHQKHIKEEAKEKVDAGKYNKSLDRQPYQQKPQKKGSEVDSR